MSPAGVDAGQASLSPFGETLPLPSGQALEAASAAEWAIGELLIRLCNGGRGLRPEPPETPPLR